MKRVFNNIRNNLRQNTRIVHGNIITTYEPAATAPVIPRIIFLVVEYFGIDSPLYNIHIIQQHSTSSATEHCFHPRPHIIVYVRVIHYNNTIQGCSKFFIRLKIVLHVKVERKLYNSYIPIIMIWYTFQF